MASANTLEPGAVAATRINDTVHLLFDYEGLVAVLYWSGSEVAQVADADGTPGEPHIFDASWWVVMQDAPELRVQADDAPPWDADAADAERAAVIAGALEVAVGIVARHRAEKAS